MGRQLLLFLILLSAVLAIYFQQTAQQQLFIIFKPLTTILILLLPLIFEKKEVKSYFYSIVIALIFCLIGDIFLLNNEQFIYGLGAFLLAHLLFAYGFTSLDGINYYKLPLVVLSLFGVAFYGFISDGLGELSVAVGIYIFFILLMGWQGLSLYIKEPKKVFASIGMAVLLFLFSDAIIAIDLFKQAFEYSGILILSSYWLSISLLAHSTIDIQKEQKAIWN